MSDQTKGGAADMASFFDRELDKKKNQKSKQQKQAQQKKQEEQLKKVEEEKKAAAHTGEFESSDEEDTSAQIEGVGKIKDIKEVKKVKEQAKAAEREHDFWKTMEGQAGHSGMGAGQAAQETKPVDHKGGFQKGTQKPTVPSGFEKDGIKFSKGRPQFKKSEHVGNKGEFPELGNEEAKKQELPKAAVGGPIGQLSAPAKGARTQNQFQGLQDAEEKGSKSAATHQELKAEPVKPKFVGSLKGLFNKQNEANAEANKNLEEHQRRIAEGVKIHEAKPPKREPGAEEEKTGIKQHDSDHRRREGGERVFKKPIAADAEHEADHSDDDGFEHVEEEKKREHGRRGGRGGARGGFHRGTGEERGEPKPHRQGVIGEQKPKPAAAVAASKPATTAQAPKKQEQPKPAATKNFQGWGDEALF